MAGTGGRAARVRAALCGPVLLALAAVGCGNPEVGQSTPQDTRPRREKVAAAWEGSAALRQWRGGHHRPEPPIAPLDTFDHGTAPLFGHSARSADTASFTVTAGHGSCDAGVAVDVLEGAGTVVLAGRILVRTDLEPGAGCDAMMHVATVPVTLSRPVGDRVLLDAASGAPLEFRDGG